MNKDSMITEQEAQNLVGKLIELKNKSKNSNDIKDKIQLRQYEARFLKNFEYIIDMKTNKYKKFNNYQDLRQECYEALVKAINNYDSQKGSFFWWLHHYTETRVSRNANQHTTIRYPLKYAKNNPPIRTTINSADYTTGFKDSENKNLLSFLQDINTPDKNIEYNQISEQINNIYSKLTKEQQDVINLAFGFENEKPMSINKICHKLNISRNYCVKLLKNAIGVMKNNIKI